MYESMIPHLYIGMVKVSDIFYLDLVVCKLGGGYNSKEISVDNWEVFQHLWLRGKS